MDSFAALDLSLRSFTVDDQDDACVEGPIKTRSGHNAPKTTLSPLRQWAETERSRSCNPEFQKYSSLRKLNVAFGIAKLLQTSGYRTTRVQQLELINIDNFLVRESVEEASNLSRDTGWEVIGIDLIAPSLSLAIASFPFSGDFFDNNIHLMGREVSANIISGSFDATQDCDAGGDESLVLWSLGVLVHFAFSGLDVPKDAFAQEQEQNKYYKTSESMSSWNDFIGDPIEIEEQPRKRSSMRSESDSYSRGAAVKFTEVPKSNQSSVKLEMSHLTVSSRSEASSGTQDGSMGNLSRPGIRMLQESGLPRVMIQLVDNLLGCKAGVFRPDDAYPSLQAVIDDLQIMLKEPNKYLLTSDSRKWLSNIKYYGRSAEASKITDAFCRVGSTGDSEAVVIGGYSGCGKTRLVQSVRGAIEAAGGYIVKQKFDQTSTQSRLTVVLTAFNELCLVIKENNTPETVNAMYEELINVFGANFQLLVRVLPNVVRMSSSDVSAFPAEHQVDSNVNFFSLCYTIQRFIRVVSSCSHPLVLVLDDLQWADPISMGLVHSVLSDIKGSSVMLFVGTYRDNEVEPDHIIFGFLQQLVPFHVTVTKFHLDGISEVEVNTMISDALGILPRFCGPLAQVITRKTKGNPYFVLELLRSLIDNNAVKYSLREGCWMWDIDEICAQDVTSNVLDLLSNKLNGLSNSMQNALKVASCFGIKLPVEVATKLASTEQYSDLVTSLEKAVLEGFLHIDGIHYQFVHDKVRESAYTMISSGDRARFHFEIGMSLYTSCPQLNVDDSVKLFITIEQINHGVPSLLNTPSQRISIAQLNCQAGLLAMKFSNFTSGLIYSQAAVSLLPDDSWESHYQLTLSCHYQLAKSAIPCGAIDTGKQASEKIIKHGKYLDDKLDAYIILINVLHYEQDELSQALKTCCHVLKMLGETVPVSLKTKQIISIVDIVRTRIKCSFTSTEDLLHMDNIGSKKSASIMRFYDQLVILAYNSSPFASGYYISRFTRYCIDNKVMCRHTPMALVTFSAHLCYGFILKSCQEGYRIGQIGLTLLNQSEARMEELSRVNTVYYGYVGVLFEPLQGCVDMHNLGYEVGMQTGNFVDAFFNLCFGIPWAIFAGSNLNGLKEEIACYIRLAEQHSHSILATYMQYFQQTVLLLIGDESSFTLTTDQSKIVDAIPLHLVQLIMPALYRGHFERVIYLHKKWESLDPDRRKRVPLRGILVAYYSGLAFAEIYRKKGTKKFISSISDALSILSKAKKLSEWNFKHKHSLLSAENFSIQGKNIEAELKYEDAIASAHSSKFLHEEALACELAGMHFKGKGNHSEKALSLFRQAERCYTDWGSLIKARQMKHLIGMTQK